MLADGRHLVAVAHNLLLHLVALCARLAQAKERLAAGDAAAQRLLAHGEVRVVAEADGACPRAQQLPPHEWVVRHAPRRPPLMLHAREAEVRLRERGEFARRGRDAEEEARQW